MKQRLCDSCGKAIDGKYIKCCESLIEDGKYKLNHVGDLCLNCWNNVSKNKKGHIKNG